MADTHGFEAVAELTTKALLLFMKSSWKSGGDRPGAPAPKGVIPEYIDLDPGAAFGGFKVKDGRVYIPREGVEIEAAAPDSLRLKLELKATAQLRLIVLMIAPFFEVLMRVVQCEHDVDKTPGGYDGDNG